MNRVVRPRINGDEDLSPTKFRERFRLERAVVEKILHFIGDDLAHDTDRNHALTPKQQLLLTLRFLATGSFYHVVGDAHGPSKATVYRAVHRAVEAIVNRLMGLIAFPNTHEATRALQAQFHGKAGLPNVIGCIDGCHIDLRVPTDVENAYINRHQRTSLNVMAVAGADGRFLCVSAHAGGRQHDSRVLATSGLVEKLETDSLVPVGGGVLLGDSAYPSRRYLLTPINHPGTAAEERYNKAHCRTRVCVEQAFGQLKMRWWCLKHGLRFHRVADSVRTVM
ncbi:putative nuclease HARBI1 [Amphibalanus amphitrite]|nr:putative nuclease HARBI1 [Amphibalanus amphitrite]